MNTKRKLLILSASIALAGWSTMASAQEIYIPLVSKGFQHQFWQAVKLGAEGANWPPIKDWARRKPKRVQDMLWANPRVVFFREEPLPDPSVGPRGAQGVPLTPGRSIAVDPLSVPYGTPVWLDTTEPLSTRPLQRLVLAQDTGSAIVGAVRADYFWGLGDAALEQAGRMKQPLRYFALWPKPVDPR